MLIPGFLAGDASLRRMALWLRSGGYITTRSGVVWNVDCMEQTLAAIEPRLEAAVQEAGRPALLVGQSRGGVMARALTTRRPDLVEILVTLGSPVVDQLAVRRPGFVAIGAVGLAGTAGMPGFFGLGCLRESGCCARARAVLSAPFPNGVGYFAVFSRNDEIVSWKACVEASASPIEVTCSHVGMGFDSAVWSRLTAAVGNAQSLGLPETQRAARLRERDVA
jgi:pimeloyl-ACP methyl ester carboxylesterase